MSLRIDFLDPTTPTWPAELASLWADLGAPHNPDLLPDYFVQTTFVRMGGRALRIADDDGLYGVALLFPRDVEGGRRVYTLRVSDLESGAEARYGQRIRRYDNSVCAERVGHMLRPYAIIPYRPSDARTYAATHRQFDVFDIGAPGAEELPSIRALRAAIWGTAPGVHQYPSDLYSAEFGPGTALVARTVGTLAGFLLGFYRFAGLDELERVGVDTALGIESQMMGVAHNLRRAGLAAALKRAQATAALDRGIGVIHWTADPLQFPNATLNFHKLRAVAGEFYPAFYPFQNELNRVHASRFGITWLPTSAWGSVGRADRPREDRHLARFPGCVILNHGPQILTDSRGAPHIAVEIPVDWTALQRDDLAAATAWRAATDTILAEAVGFASGRYLIADVAMASERHYLVGHAFTPEMLVPHGYGHG
ncbi:MAG: GNAT family N-acetyltransferase [Chloroflexales bacterium]